MFVKKVFLIMNGMRHQLSGCVGLMTVLWEDKNDERIRRIAGRHLVQCRGGILPVRYRPRCSVYLTPRLWLNVDWLRLSCQSVVILSKLYVCGLKPGSKGWHYVRGSVCNCTCLFQLLRKVFVFVVVWTFDLLWCGWVGLCYMCETWDVQEE